MAIGRVNTGGGGTGGTLVVTGVAGDTITATKDGKTYSRTFNSAGKAVFRGLATGIWALTMTNGSQTITRNVTITADYSLTMAYFTATITVTYPANSTCTCSDGTTTLTDTNAGTSEKTITFTVPNTGNWTVSCTNGTNTASQTVSITAEGQAKSVDLAYTLYIFKSGEGAKVEYYAGHGGLASIAVGTDKITMSYSGTTGAVESCFRAKDKYNLSNYSTLYLDLVNSKSLSDQYRLGVYISTTAYTWEDVNQESVESKGYPEITSTRKTYSLDISKMQGEYYVGFGGVAQAEIYNFWLK